MTGILASLCHATPLFSHPSQASFSDVVQIPPSDFHKSGSRAIEDWINAKYANKVLHRGGLCVGLHSIQAMSEGQIGKGTGGGGIVNVNIDFSMVVFRPFRGEIIPGVISSANPKDGVWLSMDFLDDLLAPPQLLFEGTSWDRDDFGTEAFVWHPSADDEYFFDRAEICLFRVEDETWCDLSPKTQGQEPTFEQKKLEASGDDAQPKTPYLIRGSMALTGLGPTLWWEGGQSEEVDEMEVDEMEVDEMEVDGLVNGESGNHPNGR